jgi:4-azaleucine resistance transporter AzlC
VTRTAAFRAGLRAGAPFAFAGFLLSLSFGVLARDAGMPTAAVIVMSLIVFAGSAQFAAISILAAGGGIGAAVAASAMMNSRFLAMGIALAPSLPGGPWKRAAQGQAIVDSSWAMSAKGDGTFDRIFLFGATAVQYVTWQSGTIAGALSGNLLGDVHKLGLDAVYPAFFLAILMVELRRPGGAVVAIAGALIALALIPFTPAGVPVLASSVAAFYGLLLRRQA